MPQDAITIAAGPTPASVNMVHTGTGAPSHSAPKGTLYLRQDGSSASTRAYSNSDGSTTWVAVTTAS
jgi:hypothetical protein